MSVHVRRMPEQVCSRYYYTIIPSSQLTESDEGANVLRAEAEATSCLFIALCSDFLLIVKHDFLTDSFEGILSIGDETTMLLARTCRVDPGVSQLF